METNSWIESGWSDPIFPTPAEPLFRPLPGPQSARIRRQAGIAVLTQPIRPIAQLIGVANLPRLGAAGYATHDVDFSHSLQRF